MRNIKEILRLKWLNGVSARGIAKSCGMPRSTVGNCLQRATAASLSWPLPEDMNDTRLKQLLYPPKELSVSESPLPSPDMMMSLKKTKLHQQGYSEGIDFRIPHKQLILSLTSCERINKAYNILIFKATSTSKSYPACALAHNA